MRGQPSTQAGKRPGVILLGAAMALVGSFILFGLAFISHSSQPTCEALAMSLGLAPAAAISATAQVVLLVGIWLMWSAARKG